MEIVHRLWWLFHSEKNKCHRLSIHFPSHFSPALSPHTRTLAFVSERRGAGLSKVHVRTSNGSLSSCVHVRVRLRIAQSLFIVLRRCSSFYGCPFPPQFRRPTGRGRCVRTDADGHPPLESQNERQRRISVARPTDRPTSRFCFHLL